MTSKKSCCPKPEDMVTLQALEKVYGNLTNGTYSVIKGGGYNDTTGRKVKEIKY